MLNQELKKTALNIHEKAKNRYNETYETTIKLCQALYDERKESLVLIRSIETLVTTDSSGNTTTKTTVDEVKNLLVPTTSEILWGVISGDILSTAWNRLTGNTAGLLGIGFRQIGAITGAPS